MKSITEFLQTRFLKPLLIVFIAGVLVFSNVACSQNGAGPTVGDNPGTTGQDMYPYEDNRMDTSAADAKAKRVIKQNERLREDIDSPGEYVDANTPDKSLGEQAEEAGRSAKQAAKNAGESTKQAAKNAVENTEKGLENVKKNTQKALDQAEDAVDQAT